MLPGLEWAGARAADAEAKLVCARPLGQSRQSHASGAPESPIVPETGSVLLGTEGLVVVALEGFTLSVIV
jgi:hypothetical protein